MGRAKAAVFPEPVSASPMISRPAGDRREDPTRLLTVLAALPLASPCRATGRLSRCMAVGDFQLRAAHASHKTSVTPYRGAAANISGKVLLEFGNNQ